jgi:hypothetical protein
MARAREALIRGLRRTFALRNTRRIEEATVKNEHGFFRLKIKCEARGDHWVELKDRDITIDSLPFVFDVTLTFGIGTDGPATAAFSVAAFAG